MSNDKRSIGERFIFRSLANLKAGVAEFNATDGESGSGISPQMLAMIRADPFWVAVHEPHRLK
ncbi:hypothetical protein [Erwinia sp. S59]|uniref:hypothetical protein n=1 Tax=Erwinia sp. S59 TaxID=2769340 RepID=UPI0019096E33|nr:hypothetical protein [Erwinia sp. S59]MBK0092803.1 hypothetical protein [Erwinia sp. S59]